MAQSYSVQAVLSAVDKNFSSTMDKALSSVSKLGSNTSKTSSTVSGSGQKMNSTFKSVASAMGLVQIASKAFDVVKNSVGAAVNRIDTLNNSNKVFQNMGFSAKETKSAMKGLEASIKGLPTPLDQAVQGVQMVASATGDLGKSQQIWSALNDAILGFGGSTEDVERATLQLSQAFAAGKIDAETWNSMLDAQMGPTLKAIAKQMGLTMAELKDGLSKGSISVEQFQDALIDLDKNGGGGLASLHKIAMDSTNGISTSMANAKTAVSRGVAGIIAALDKALTANKFPTIAQMISQGGQIMESALQKVASVIPPIVNAIANLSHGLIPLAPLMKAVGVAVVALVAAFAGATKINSFLSLMKQLGSLLGAFASPVGIAVAAIAALGVAFYQMYTKSETFRNAVQKIMTAFGNTFGPIIQSAISAVGRFGESLFGAGGKADNLAKKIGDGIGNALNKINWDQVASVASQAFNVIGQAVKIVVTVIKSIVTAIGQVLEGFNSVSGAGAVWNILKTIISGVWTILKTIITTVQNVVEAFTGIQGAGNFWKALGVIIGSIAQIVSKLLADCKK